MSKRYYLKADFNDDWTEVSLEQYCRAERAAGFRPKLWSGDPNYMTTPATGGFSGGNVSGRIAYFDESAKHPQNQEPSD